MSELTTPVPEEAPEEVPNDLAKDTVSTRVVSDEPLAPQTPPEPQAPEQDNSKTPENPVEPIKPKKRMSLQERLALAAKKGAAASSQRHSSRTTSTTLPSSVESTPRTSMDTSRTSIDVSRPCIEEAPENLDSLAKEKLIELLEKSRKAQDEATARIEQLEKDVRRARRDESPMLISVRKRLEQKEKQLEQKEQQVAELMEEGTKLSAREVSLNQTLKQMRMREADYEIELGKLEVTVQKLESEAKKSATEGQEATESIQKELQAKLAELEKQAITIDRTKAQLASEKEARALLQKRADLSEEKEREINRLKARLETERQSREKTIGDSREEVKRLEAKLEALRIRSESKLEALQETKEKAGSMSVDMLQAQLTEAQENWKVIEDSYVGKISNLGKDVDVLKRRDSEHSKKVKALTNDLQVRTREITELMDMENSLNQKLEDTLKKLNISEKETLTQKERYASLQHDYEHEKNEFEKKLKELMEEKMRIEETLKLRTETAVNGDGNTSFSNMFYLNDLNSSASFGRKRTTSSTNIDFGESATTPNISQSQSQLSFGELSTPTPKRNYSGGFAHTPIPEDSSDILVRDDTSTLAAADMVIPESPSVNGTSGSATNLQLVSRLSAHVRRLELELMSLREENADLSKLKAETSNEIAKLLKEAERSREYQRSAQAAEAALEDIKHKYGTTLELLGEKSERVGELEADVDDLKDLMRQQVQQMVEMQTQIDGK